jgi:hypothetical protein
MQTALPLRQAKYSRINNQSASLFFVRRYRAVPVFKKGGGKNGGGLQRIP